MLGIPQEDDARNPLGDTFIQVHNSRPFPLSMGNNR